MQGTLLVMCIVWTFRQRRLGIDDFGNPLDGSGVPALVRSSGDDPLPEEPVGEETPLLGRRDQ